jgi:hypothetical protein
MFTSKHPKSRATDRSGMRPLIQAYVITQANGAHTADSRASRGVRRIEGRPNDLQNPTSILQILKRYCIARHQLEYQQNNSGYDTGFHYPIRLNKPGFCALRN